jgi:ABC-type amino acid transport substrate-binding protein
MQEVLALLIGVGLAAAAGLRVFLPLFGLSLAAIFGGLHLSPEMQWLARPEAATALGAATVLEVGAGYIPLLDHLLDTIAAPGAVVAGTLATAALLTGFDDPALKWALALIAGGGMAGLMQAGSMVARVASTASTGGLANPLVATGEWLGSLLLTVLAIVAPLLVIFLLLAGILCWLRRRLANNV